MVDIRKAMAEDLPNWQFDDLPATVPRLRSLLETRLVVSLRLVLM